MYSIHQVSYHTVNIIFGNVEPYIGHYDKVIMWVENNGGMFHEISHI